MVDSYGGCIGGRWSRDGGGYIGGGGGNGGCALVEGGCGCRGRSYGEIVAVEQW